MILTLLSAANSWENPINGREQQGNPKACQIIIYIAVAHRSCRLCPHCLVWTHSWSPPFFGEFYGGFMEILSLKVNWPGGGWVRGGRKGERATRSFEQVGQVVWSTSSGKVNWVDNLWTVVQINNFCSFQAVRYCRGGKVLSSGGSGMGSPFMLQQKTCQAAFQDLSVQGQINSYLGRFIFFSSLFLLLLLPSLSSTGFSFLFHSSCLVFSPACLSQTFLQVSSGSIVTYLFQEQHWRFLFGAWKGPHAYVAHLDS